MATGTTSGHEALPFLYQTQRQCAEALLEVPSVVLASFWIHFGFCGSLLNFVWIPFGLFLNPFLVSFGFISALLGFI